MNCNINTIQKNLNKRNWSVFEVRMSKDAVGFQDPRNQWFSQKEFSCSPLAAYCTLPPPPPPLPLVVSLCYKTYDSPDFKPLLLLTDSAIDDNTTSPSLTQERIGEEANCPSSWRGPHASGFNHSVHSDSAIWLAQLRTHDQFHDQSLLCLLAELKCNLRTSRKGTVIGSPIRTTRTREEHILKVNVGVCYYRGCEWEDLFGRVKTNPTHPTESNHFC